MPSHRLRNAFATACLVVSAIAAMPSPASALEPPRPLPGYRPAFVTELGGGPVIDCLWASGSMLLDKWTAGRVTASRQKLRALSGDRRGGSSLDDLQRAYARLGIGLRYSPDGGAPIGWHALLRRLASGAGAVILGDDGDLPFSYARWDYGFWKKTGADDNHALYVERYDARHGRLWVMDPLARGKWNGQWMPVWALERFAWRTRGGLLYAAVTPTARPAPFAGVRVGSPVAVLAADAVRVSWPVRAHRGWRYTGADAAVTFRPLDDPLLAAARSAPPPPAARAPAATAAPGGRARATFEHGQLVATAGLPAKPGAYVANLSLTDRRFGHRIATSGRLTVFVPGPRQARLRIQARSTEVVSRASIDLSVSVANTGTLTWLDPPRVLGGAPTPGERNTRVVGRWVSIAPASEAASSAASRAAAVVGGEIALAPGRLARLDVTVQAPDEPGRWALVLDVVDDVDGSFAAHGSAPAVLMIDVVPVRGLDAGF